MLQILQLKQESEKDRENLARLQSNDVSLERLEKSQVTIQELRSEIAQLKQETFTRLEQFEDVQNHTHQLHIENNHLTLRMKQLKERLEQVQLAEPDAVTNDEELLLAIDLDVEKASQRTRDLYDELDTKTRRIAELDIQLNEEKHRTREIETKLKIILELRERDTHLHIRQLGQTDAELRKARTDTERVQILHQQIELQQ